MILWLDEDAFDIEGPTTERNIIVGVAHFFYACANPLTLVFALNHDGTERVLGSKSLENELLWTSVNVLVVSPVVQIKGSISLIVCATNNFNVKLPKLISVLH